MPDNSNPRTPQNDPAHGASTPMSRPGACPYCGAWLDARYYFCVQCAAPWRAPETDPVYQPVPEPVVRDEFTLLQRDGRPSMTLFFAVLVGILLPGLVGMILGGENGMGSALVLTDAVLGLLAFGFLVRWWNDVRHLFVHLGMRDRMFWLCWPGLLVLLAINLGYFRVLQGLIGASTDEEALNPFAGVPTGIIFLTVCVGAAVIEEVVFRGLLQTWFARVFSRRKTIVLTAAFFMVAHMGAVLSWPYLFCVGLYLCWVRERTGSIYPVVLLHFVHNFVVSFWV